MRKRTKVILGVLIGVLAVSSVLLFVGSSLLGVWLYRRHRHGTALEEEIDEELGEARAGSDPAPR